MAALAFFLASPARADEAASIVSISNTIVYENRTITPVISDLISSLKSDSCKYEIKRHRVRKGDSLWGIAGKAGTTVSKIKDMNGLKSGRIRPGQWLLLERPAIDEEFMADPKAAIEAQGLESYDAGVRVVFAAARMLNVPYRFGGASAFGMDCSAFVRYVFGLFGIELPRTAREQFKTGLDVGRDGLSAGDLVFFRTYAKFPSHVGIYIGENLFIHASSAERRVKIDSIEAGYYKKRFLGGKRVVGGLY